VQHEIHCTECITSQQLKQLHFYMFHHMMNHITVMVGPMGGYMRGGMPADNKAQSGMGMTQSGPATSPWQRVLQGDPPSAMPSRTCRSQGEPKTESRFQKVA
jgi:hypothetical protein